MIEVIGGDLFQWDTGRVIRINTDTNIHEVHFTTKDMTYAYVVSTYEKDGAVYCEIPNIILQQEKSLICYEITNTDGGEMTVAEKTLTLHKRNKPQDYVYTEDELKNFDRLAALIPTKLSQLTDDIGAGGAKITSVNGISPDENGNVEVQAGIDSADVARIVKNEFAGGVGYVASKEIVTLYPETQLDFIEQYGLYVHQTTTSDFMLPVVGETYTVKWDGTEYECACSTIADTYPALGNLSMAGLTGGEEYPFIIAEQNGRIIIETATSGTSHRISILGTETTYSLIDSNYLPEYKYVSYETQNLTDTEKEIARNNINAIDKSVLIQIPDNIVLASDFEAYYEKYRKTGLPIIWNGEIINHIRWLGTRGDGFKEYYIIEEHFNPRVLKEYEYNGEKYVSLSSTRNYYEILYTDQIQFKVAGEKYSDIKINWNGNLYNENGVVMLWKNGVRLSSCTEGSTKQFKITVDDSGTITATEVSN